MVDIASMKICQIDKNLCDLLQFNTKSYIDLGTVFENTQVNELLALAQQIQTNETLFWIAEMKDAEAHLHPFHHYISLVEKDKKVQILAIAQARSPKLDTLITENIRLKNSVENLSYSCKVSQIGHWTLDLQTFMLSLSKEKCMMLGIPIPNTSDFSYDMNVMEYAEKYVLAEDVSIIQQNLQLALENANNLSFTISFEYRFIHPLSGELRFVAVKGALTNPEILNGVSQDITELKKTREEREKFELYRNLIFENSKDAIMLFDENGMIDCNVASVEIFRCKDKSALIGKEISSFSPDFQPNGKPSAEVKAEIMHTIQEQKHITFEWQHKRADNSLFFAEVSVILVHLNGKDLELVTIKDVSERKQIIEDLTTQIQNAEQFTYIVSHNLRSPIARIVALAESLSDNDNPEWRTFVIQNLQKDAQQLNQLTIDLNTILNLKKEKGHYNEEVSIPDTLVDSIEMLKDMIAEQEAKILVDIECEQPVMGVKEYMKSIFHNLISNAIKYRHPNRIPEICIRVVAEEDKCIIWVKDNGIGIDLAKHKDKVFGLYKRFHPQIQGRGVGLHITKTQVEMMGGKIFIESKINEGTTFKIVLNKL